jgi:tetratricopeptide (TPR) repeat protein
MVNSIRKIMKTLSMILFLICILGCGKNTTTTTVNAQSISLAKDFYTHNLNERALETFIIIYNTPNVNADDKSEALFFMGQITFDEGRFSVALADWQKLIKDFPTSKRAVEIKDRLIQLKDVFSKSVDENISSSVAQSYINNGDFWADDNKIFHIDGSWLPKVELSIDWYDKVIKEFPGTYAAELAYSRKLFAINGWEESGQYGTKYGIMSDFKKYIPILLQTFDSFEAAFPESPFLQGFRYQIAQAYWGKKDWANTKSWLNKIIEKGEGKPSFYSETAKARLNKIEY